MVESMIRHDLLKWKGHWNGDVICVKVSSLDEPKVSELGFQMQPMKSHRQDNIVGIFWIDQILYEIYPGNS